MNTMLKALSIALLAALGCSGSGSGSGFDQTELVESVGNTVIIPAYQAFADETAILVTEAESFCAAPSESSLESLQTQWRATRGAWKINAFLEFGPWRDQPWRLGPFIDFFPVREGTITGNLASDEPFTIDRVRGLGASSRGLASMEFLIFNTDGLSTAFAEFEGDTGEQRCGYVAALAQDLDVNANAMVDAWSADGDDYLGSLLDSGTEDAPFMSIRAVTNELLTRMLVAVNEIRTDRMAIPLGLESGGETRPDDLESRYSDNSIADILSSLDGLEALYTGTFDGTTGTSFRDWVETRNRAVAAEVTEEIQRTREAVQAIPEPLRLAIENDPDSVQNAIDVALDLRNVVGTDMVNALGGTVSFEGDGD